MTCIGISSHPYQRDFRWNLDLTSSNSLMIRSTCALEDISIEVWIRQGLFGALAHSLPKAWLCFEGVEDEITFKCQINAPINNSSLPDLEKWVANSDSCHQVSLPNLLTLTFGDGFNQSLDNVNLD